MRKAKIDRLRLFQFGIIKIELFINPTKTADSIEFSYFLQVIQYLVRVYYRSRYKKPDSL